MVAACAPSWLISAGSPSWSSTAPDGEGEMAVPDGVLVCALVWRLLTELGLVALLTVPPTLAACPTAAPISATISRPIPIGPFRRGWLFCGGGGIARACMLLILFSRSGYSGVRDHAATSGEVTAVTVEPDQGSVHS